jgi:UMF1 family MFS transporter
MARACCRPTCARGIAWAAPRRCRRPSAPCSAKDVVTRDGERWVVVDSLMREWIRAEDVLMAGGWLARLGLRTREQRAWATYDWANSAFQCTIITAVFPIYFTSVASKGVPQATATEHFATATTIALTIIAVLSPVLGAYADYAGAKKRLLAVFLAIGVVTTAAMYFIGEGEWKFAAVLFIIANIGVSGSFVFYDSLLPHIARADEMDRVSSAGYALGYLGGGLLLTVNLAWILKPAWFGIPDAGVASRLSFVSVAIWWLGFSIPMFRHVPEPAVRPRICLPASGRWRLVPPARATVRELTRYREAFLMLIAFLIYNDGIGTIIRMAGPYGKEIGLPDDALITAFVMVQFVGIPFAFAFGALAGRIGAKPSVFIALMVYVIISIIGYFMDSAWEFWLLSFLVAMVQGGSQALSRSLFASMIPKQKSSSFLASSASSRSSPGSSARRFSPSPCATRLEPQRDPLGDRVLRHRRDPAVESRRRARAADGQGRRIGTLMARARAWC